jgi:hypothetical protein
LKLLETIKLLVGLDINLEAKKTVLTGFNGEFSVDLEFESARLHILQNMLWNDSTCVVNTVTQLTKSRLYRDKRSVLSEVLELK